MRTWPLVLHCRDGFIKADFRIHKTFQRSKINLMYSYLKIILQPGLLTIQLLTPNISKQHTKSILSFLQIRNTHKLVMGMIVFIIS